VAKKCGGMAWFDEESKTFYSSCPTCGIKLRGKEEKWRFSGQVNIVFSCPRCKSSHFREKTVLARFLDVVFLVA